MVLGIRSFKPTNASIVACRSRLPRMSYLHKLLNSILPHRIVFRSLPEPGCRAENLDDTSHWVSRAAPVGLPAEQPIPMRQHYRQDQFDAD